MGGRSTVRGSGGFCVGVNLGAGLFVCVVMDTPAVDWRMAGQDGDRLVLVGSFDGFFEAEFRRVVALVFGLTGSRWVAEEIVQDAFLEAHRRWGEVSGLDRPDAWVRTVAMNRARSWSRRAGAEARALGRFVGQRRSVPDELPESSEGFWREVRGLSGRQCEVLVLHYLEDRSVAEIATMLGIAEGTVKVHLHRGRLSLAERLGLEVE